METQELRRTPHPDLTRLIDDWIQQTRQALSALKNQPFDKQLWNS